MFTFATKYLFLAHGISEYFSFSLFMLKANINLRKKGQLLKATCSFLYLIVHMTSKLHSHYGFTQFG